jgi:hypothetical protein
MIFLQKVIKVMQMRTFEERLEKTEGLADIFELVKEGVRRIHKRGRAGLTLGLAELGGRENFWIGAFYPVGSNTIIVNKTPIRSIFQEKPSLFRPYIFHILLHEYLHSLGYLDEASTRKLARHISKELFGENHVVTKMAEDMGRFLPKIVYPPLGWQPGGKFHVEMVEDFDRSSTEYIM